MLRTYTGNAVLCWSCAAKRGLTEADELDELPGAEKKCFDCGEPATVGSRATIDAAHIEALYEGFESFVIDGPIRDTIQSFLEAHERFEMSHVPNECYWAQVLTAFGAHLYPFNVPYAEIEDEPELVIVNHGAVTLAVNDLVHQFMHLAFRAGYFQALKQVGDE